MPDLNRKHFGYGQRAARIGPDCISLIQLPASNLVLFFQRRHRSYCAKPIQIQSGWPGQGLAKHIWSGSEPMCWNRRARFLAECNQPTTSFPLARLHSSTYLLDHTVQKQPGANLVLADCVGFGPNGSGPEASWCARIIRIQFSSGCVGFGPNGSGPEASR